MSVTFPWSRDWHRGGGVGPGGHGGRHAKGGVTEIASDQFLAGGMSSLGLLTTEQSLVAADSAVASSDAALELGQFAVLKASGGDWAASKLSLAK